MIDVLPWLFWAAVALAVGSYVLWRRTGFCPYCKGRVPIQATACRHCTRTIVPPD